jgi:ribosomal protein S18 acetylase RimI-like enzyme
MTIKIRNAAEKDFARIAELGNQVNEHHRRIMPGTFAPGNDEERLQRYAKYVADKEKYCFIAAEQDGEIIGYLQAEFTDSPWYEKRRGCMCNELGIDEACQSKGTAIFLFRDFLRKECAKRSVQQIRLNVWLANERVLKLYRRLGFREASVKMNLDLR